MPDKALMLLDLSPVNKITVIKKIEKSKILLLYLSFKISCKKPITIKKNPAK